jgi:hypothetical protein
MSETEQIEGGCAAATSLPASIATRMICDGTLAEPHAACAISTSAVLNSSG